MAWWCCGKDKGCAWCNASLNTPDPEPPSHEGKEPVDGDNWLAWTCSTIGLTPVKNKKR
jgi:hypothetical protein